MRVAYKALDVYGKPTGEMREVDLYQIISVNNVVGGIIIEDNKFKFIALEFLEKRSENYGLTGMATPGGVGASHSSNAGLSGTENEGTKKSVRSKKEGSN